MLLYEVYLHLVLSIGSTYHPHLHQVTTHVAPIVNPKQAFHETQRHGHRGREREAEAEAEAEAERGEHT